jgi:hypothetical protein
MPSDVRFAVCVADTASLEFVSRYHRPVVAVMGPVMGPERLMEMCNYLA